LLSLFKQYSATARRVWDAMSEEERQQCLKIDPIFAAEASGDHARQLAQLNADIQKTPQEAGLFLQRALLRKKQWNLAAMVKDRETVVRIGGQDREYAQYVLGEHLVSFGLWHYGLRQLKAVRDSGIGDKRIDRVRLAEIINID